MYAYIHEDMKRNLISGEAVRKLNKRSTQLN